MMDAVSVMLRDVSVTGTLLDGAEPTAGTRARLTLVVLLEGTARCRIADQETRLTSGEAALSTIEGAQVRLDGDNPEEPMRVLRVGYDVQGSVAGRVLEPLPDLAHVPATPGGCPTLDMIESELRSDVPGREVVLDLLYELLLVSTLREWFALPDSPAPAGYRAHTDPVVGATLRRIHDAPAEPWTVDTLARAAGVSRATLAARFAELVGQPPMAYLAEWRLCCACDLLTQSELPIEAIAARVGYSSASAISTAFANAFGVRPGAHRRAHRLGAGPAPIG